MTVDEIRRRYLLVEGLRWLGPGFLTPVLTLLLLDGGLSLAQVGVVVAAYSTSVLVLELPTGGLADAVGPKRVLVASAATSTLGTALLATGRGLAWLLVAAVVLGVGRALDSGPLESWYVNGVRALDPAHDVTRGLGAGGVVGGVALGVGALSAGLAPNVLTGEGVLSPLRLPALLATAFGLVHVVAVVALLPRVVDGEGAEALRAEVRRVPRLVADAVRLARGSRALQRLLVCTVVFALAWVPMEFLWQPRLADLLGGAEQRTEVFGFLATAGFFASALGSWVGPRLAILLRGRDRAALVSTLVAAVGLAAFGWAATPWLAAGAFALTYVANGMWGPAQRSLLHDTVGDAHRTTVLSGTSLSVQLAAVASQLTLMPLAEDVGIPPVFAVMAGVAVVGGLLFLGLEGAVRAGRPGDGPAGDRDLSRAGARSA